jgi:hypothetical protein
MTHWNYRVMRRKRGDEILYGLHEVFYDEEGNTDGWTENPVDVFADSPEELKQTLLWMQIALTKPILDYDEGIIDWKHLVTTPGYISLKAAYIKDVREAAIESYPMRNKAEFLRKFNWVIGRAQHYALKQKISIERVLNHWEEERSHWWLNYYQECNQPKLHSSALQPKKVKKPLQSTKKPPKWRKDYKIFKRSVS